LRGRFRRPVLARGLVETSGRRGPRQAHASRRTAGQSGHGSCP